VIFRKNGAATRAAFGHQSRAAGDWHRRPDIRP
jgi:hypothetical protein